MEGLRSLNSREECKLNLKDGQEMGGFPTDAERS